jgi:hypothetical protein
VSAALERLLGLAAQWSVPLVLAVVPAPAEPALAARLGGLAGVRVAVHGLAHRSHAGPGEKKQELGAHRPPAAVLDEISSGRDRLNRLFGGQALPMLVPPWNRIAPELLPHLPGLGIRYLSTIGPQPPHEPVPDLVRIDCQLDIMDWRNRRSHDHELLWGRLAELVRGRAALPGPIGLLTHHLVHDEQAWKFLSRLFELTAGHEAVSWAWPVPEIGA